MQAGKKGKLANVKKNAKRFKNPVKHIWMQFKEQISQQRIKEVMLLMKLSHPVWFGKDKEMKMTKRLALDDQSYKQ